jgi:hypothetical protein
MYFEVFSPPYHPQSNAAEEIINKTIEKYLPLMKDEKQWINQWM